MKVKSWSEIRSRNNRKLPSLKPVLGVLSSQDGGPESSTLTQL